MDARPEVAELAERRGVERGGCNAGLAERREPRPHLAGRLVRERDDQHVAWSDDVRGQREGHPPRDDPGLAAPGAGQDAERPGRDRDRLALGRIEVGEEGVEVAVWHVAIVAGCPAPPVIG